MYYDPNHINWGQQGWTCPKCGRVYSPSTPMCYYCGGNSRIVYSDSTATPSWKYEDHVSTADSIYDNEWFKGYSLYDALIDAVKKSDKGYRWRPTDERE